MGPVSRRRWWLVALALVVLVVVGSLLRGGGDDESTASTSSTTSTAPSTTSPATTGEVSSTTTTSTTTPEVPGIVAVVSADPGGGSGEVTLDWDAVPGATGYRIERSAAATGPFEEVAALDVTTGSATVEPGAGVVNIFSEQHSYLPTDGALSQPDASAGFQYVDVGAGQRCFQVIAVNAAGEGPPSNVTCASPP